MLLSTCMNRDLFFTRECQCTSQISSTNYKNLWFMSNNSSAATKLPISQSIVLIVKVSNYVFSKFRAADVVNASIVSRLATTPSIQETGIL